MRYSSRSRSPPTISATHSEARLHRENRGDHGRRALDEGRDFERKHCNDTMRDNRRDRLPSGQREVRYSSRSRSPPTIRATHSEARFHREKRGDDGSRALDERRDFERKHRNDRRCDERRDDSRDDHRRIAATPSSLEQRRLPEKREPERWTVQMGKHKRVYQRYIGDGIGDPVIEKVKDDPRSKPDALTTGEVSQMLEKVKDDPRSKPDAFVAVGGSARNTDSWEPASTFVRPEMRVLVGPKAQVFSKTIRHDDVIVVPEFFCAEDDWSMYYTLVEEMRALQAKGQPGSGWIPWAEGNHLISKNPKGCPTYEKVCARVSEYFKIKPGSQATRFNWYRDSSDWKPFHHDSAAYNPERARDQNITVGVSFGAERELAFLHSKNGSRVYFPQCNGMLFAFGRDVNIKWKHGVNALPEAQHDGKGRISVILWGLSPMPLEEDGSPPLIEEGHSFGGGGGGGGVCRAFQKGQCTRGERCKFSHNRPALYARDY